MRGMRVGIAYVSCHRGPTDSGELLPTTEADLALSFLHTSQALLHPGLDLWFLGDSVTKMQWAKVFGFLFLVVAIVIIFAPPCIQSPLLTLVTGTYCLLDRTEHKVCDS